MSALGWILLFGGAALGLMALRRKTASGEPAPDRRWFGISAVAALALGGWMLLSTQIALANQRPVDMSRVDGWVVGGPKDAMQWEGTGGSWRRLRAKLVPESESYVAFPVDWEGDAFEAEWDMIIHRLDLRPESNERASIAIGVFDGPAANIDDPDHVGGSALQAAFSDDVRLRASDQDRLLKTHSSTELSQSATAPRPFQPSAPVQLRLETPYHCVLTYNGPSDTATLTVSEKGGKEIVSRRLEDLRDYSSNVAWFGITVRGYKRFNKQLAEKMKAQGYEKPTAEVTIENLVFRKP